MKINIIAKILIYISIFSFIIYTAIAIHIAQTVYIDNKTPSDAIIVLGARSYINGEVNQCVQARVEHAINLYNDGFAKKIIMSGGTDKKPVFHETNEALEMKKMALNLDPNINEADILIEGESTSTYENLIYSNQIMNKHSLNSAIIVTEPFHSPRANLVATSLNLDHSVSPTLTSTCWNNQKYFSTYFLREPIATIFYKLSGKI